MITKFQSVPEIVQHVIEQFPFLNRNQILHKEDIDMIVEQSQDDLDFFIESDPASKGSAELVLNSYASFLAVVAYRIGNRLMNIAMRSGNRKYETYARRISEWAKVNTGVEIHPGAKIGCPFVIDHGYGTVIGETTEIGRYCYILQGVVLGAKRIVGNPNEKRHPSLGNNVHLGAFVQIIGNISIGSDTIVGPSIKVSHSIPANSTLIRHTEYYILRRAFEMNSFTL